MIAREEGDPASAADKGYMGSAAGGRNGMVGTGCGGTRYGGRALGGAPSCSKLAMSWWTCERRVCCCRETALETHRDGIHTHNYTQLHTSACPDVPRDRRRMRLRDALCTSVMPRCGEPELAGRDSARWTVMGGWNTYEVSRGVSASILENHLICTLACCV